MKKKLALLLACCLTFTLSLLPVSALELEDAKKLLQHYYVDEIPEEILSLDSLDAILEALNDPYTVYLSEEDYDSFLSTVNGSSVTGIGVSIQTAYDDGFLILSVLPDSPALEAGLESGDRVIAVNGIPMTAVSDVTAAITGEEGTTVTVTVIRQADGSRRDYPMVRRAVQIPIVTYQQVGTAGVIDCSSFGDTTVEMVQEALTTLDESVSVWIMDLRSNPGGTTESAAGSAGLFIGSANMVHFRDADGDLSTVYTTANCPDLTDKPLIIMTSEYSASGSELFSAAARDHGFGIALGQRTFGKGIAQTIFDQNTSGSLFHGDGLKLTTYRFFSPAGTTNHLVGVLPTLLLSEEHTYAAAQLLAAAEPCHPEGYLKLELAGHTFYIQQATARSETYLAAFTELLEALPPSAALFVGTAHRAWLTITPNELAAQWGLDYTNRTFSDLADSSFQTEIETLATYELLSGYEDGTFQPAQTITRAEFCTMVSAALNLPAGNTSLLFTDTPSDAWYTPYVSAMVSRGFVSGYEDDTFRPNATITYQEMVTILSAAAAWANTYVNESCKNDLTMDEFLAHHEFAEWAQRPARNLAALDALVGDLAPTDNVTRQVAAGSLCALMEGIHLLWDAPIAETE